MFGPWPRLRALLIESGVDPQSVEVSERGEGGHRRHPSGELYVFTSSGGSRFTARVKWSTEPKGEDMISEWRS